MSIKITFLILFVTITAFSQKGNITGQQQQHDTTANTHINYRRTSDNQQPTSYYQQPKEQVFPLGWNTGTLGKVNAGSGVWIELNPNLPRTNYIGVSFTNPDTGWAAGVGGVVIKTTNGGNDWTVSNVPTNNILLKVNSYNGSTVLAAGYDGLIFRSTDA